jgi:TPR repeat protein
MSLHYTVQETLQNYAVAARWYEKAARRDANAARELSLSLASGCGVLESDAAAARCRRMAAEKGDAKRSIGGIERQRCASKWLHEIAAQGNVEFVEALATQYSCGLSVGRDLSLLCFIGWLLLLH